MTDFTVYNHLTGSISQNGNVPEKFVDNQIVEEYESVIIGEAIDYATYNIDLDSLEPVLKTDIPYTLNKNPVSADGVDEAILGNLPGEASFSLFDGNNLLADGVVTDGSLTFTFDMDGEYLLKLTHPLHLRTEVIINAV